MKQFLIATPVLATLGTSALAHRGAHMHPHGSETWLPVVLAALTVCGTIVLTYLRGRK